MTLGPVPSNAGARPVADRIALAVVVLVTAWFAFAAGWGMFGAPGGGHLGGGVASIMAAEHVIRWKMPYATWDWYTAVAPDKATYACHHPYAVFYLPVPLLWLLGHHDFVAGLPPALLSTAIPPLLYGIAKERWGRPIGAVAAASYVFVPLAVGYSSFWGLEPVCIFGVLLFFWGHSRHMTTQRRRYLVASLAGAAIGCSGDWIGYVIVGLVLGWALLRAFVLPDRWTPRLHHEPYARWWALSVAIAVGTLLLWIGIFYKADHLADWLGAGATRASGDDLPLRAVLASRKNWIDFSFTPFAILLGKIAAPVCILRFFVTRRDEDVYALALLAGGVLQYVGFKQGADIHIFWPLYFAPYFALSVAELAHAVAWAVGAIARRLLRVRPPRAATVMAYVGLVLGLAPAAVMARDGVQSLWVWRRTGGRYDDRGSLIRSDVDIVTVIKQVIFPHKEPGTTIDAHSSAVWYWHFDWQFQGKVNTPANPVAGAKPDTTHPFWIARASGMSGEEQRRIANEVHVRVYGDTWVVDQRDPPAPLDAYSMNEREPTAFEWLFYGGVEPMRTAGTEPDPWLTWEWRTAVGQDAPAPTGTPSTLDEMRIAHNAARAGGDLATAERWREQIEAKLDRSVQARFEPGLRLIGVRVVGGVEPRIESWFEVKAAPTGDAVFNVRSTIEQRARWSLIPVDTTDREMAYPTSLPTTLWQPGGIYKSEAVMNHRIGRERYTGHWASYSRWSPQRADGRLDTTLTVAP